MTPTQTLIAVIIVAALVVAGAVWIALAEPIRDPTGEEWLVWPEHHDPQPYDQDRGAKIYRPGFVHGKGRPPTRPPLKRRHHAQRDQ